ncbi:hypothetical protein [Nostoc commune]|uniref:hypothetical protein n=1 Tax=Nostoc commune TaxID=1178 RepID=UPI0018C5B178|nr:hypothetical protein [Nostoc commune]MBG1264109.1 hypothetical protein [Nostoc commune BAE]
MKSENFRKSAQLFGAIFGGLLISLPAISQAVAQESTPKVDQGEAPSGASSSTLNPNPSIFSEPPYNRSQVPVPPQPGARPPRPVPRDQIQQPLPGAVFTDQPRLLQPRETPSATIALPNGTVNITLVNETAANVTYQVIGDTAPRSLQGKSNVILQGLKVPVTVTFEREDRGQLIVTPQASSEPGSLEVTFNEATNAAQGRNALRIERNGSVFMN